MKFLLTILTLFLSALALVAASPMAATELFEAPVCKDNRPGCDNIGDNHCDGTKIDQCERQTNVQCWRYIADCKNKGGCEH